MAYSLDAEVKAFRTRPLDTEPYTIVSPGALVVKVREAGRTVNVHVLVATGVNAEWEPRAPRHLGRHQRGRGWLGLRFWRSLVARGLSGVVLVICDATRGSPAAIGETLPGVTWQRVSHPLHAGSFGQGGQVGSSPRVATLVRTIVDAPDRSEAGAQLQRVVDALVAKLSEAAEHLEEAHCNLLAFRHFRRRALAPDLEHQPSRSAWTRRSADGRMWWASSRIEPRSSALWARSSSTRPRSGPSSAGP